MRQTAGLMCLGSIYAGALWIEYQTALLLGAGCFFLAVGSSLTLLAAALYHAPEGYERRDGFHVRGAGPPCVLISLHPILSTSACQKLKRQLTISN